MKNNLYLAGFAILILFCCVDGMNAQTRKKKGKTETVTAPAPDTSRAPRKYLVKTGVVEMTSSMMEGLTQTLYFDDYGAREALYSKVESMGQTASMVVVTRDGWTVSYDADQKQGTKSTMPEITELIGVNGTVLTPDQMSDEMKKEFRYQELEMRTFVGKESKGFSLELLGMKVKEWIWNNIPMYLEMDMGAGGSLTLEVTRVDVDVVVPAEKFEVPADVRLSEQ